MAITTLSQLDLQPLIDAIQTAFHLPDEAVIYGWQAQSKRNPQFFITVAQTLEEPIGSVRLDYLDSGNELQEKAIKSTLTTVDINLYGTHANAFAKRLATALRLSYFNHAWKSMRCGLVNVSGIRDLSGVVSDSYEERANFSLTLSSELIMGNTVGFIQTQTVLLTPEE